MRIEWPYLLYTFLICIGGGLIQATTGFGFGIFVMVFFPLFLPVVQASSLSSLILIFLLSALAWRYRDHVQWKQALFPAAIYLIANTIIVRLIPKIDLSGIHFWLGVFMVLIAVYMAFMNQRIRIRPNWKAAAVCSTLSGAADGLFGIGGPPMTIYFIALLGGDKLAYLGTIQCFFWVTNLINSFNRITGGVLEAATLWLVLPGVLGQFIGIAAGNRVVRRIDSRHFQPFVYLFLAVAGILTCISGFLRS